MSLIVAATLVGLVKAVLVAALAVLNAVLSLLASVAVWKTYLAVGTKLAMVVLFCVPVVGILVYLFWGQKKVRDARR